MVASMKTAYPFDRTNVAQDADGGKYYLDRPSSLVKMLSATVDRAGDSEALVELGGRRLSYREVWDGAARVAGGLLSHGLQRGDRAAIRLPNGIDWVLAFLGCQLAGVIAVPVNMRFTDDEADYVIKDSGASWVFRVGQPLPQGTPTSFLDAESADVAAIFYTSGTTGFPKGAMTTHGNFLSNTETARRVNGFPAWDPALRNLVAVPLFHVTGCNSQLLPTLECGGTTVILPSFSLEAFLRGINEERINLLVAVPAIYWLAIHSDTFRTVDTTGVKWVAYGGAPAAPDLVRDIKRAFSNARVSNGYGLTESSSIATTLPDEDAADYAASVGYPSPVMDAKLIDVDAVTGVGELLLRGSNIVPGYWNKPEANAETFVHGWLHTGDLARIDDAGRIYIVDRKKDMINRGGENVYCVEVENALAGVPGLAEAAVIAVPDTMMGEKVGAVVVARLGAGLTPESVLAYCRTHLADFKVPQYVAVTTDPLPRNPGGKIIKGKLRNTVRWGKPLW